MKPLKQFIKRKGDQTDIEESVIGKAPTPVRNKRKRLPRYRREFQRKANIANYLVY